MPLSETPEHQEPDPSPVSVIGLMALLSRYDQLSAANEIIENHPDDEARIAELKKLLQNAEQQLSDKLAQIAYQVQNQVNFSRLKSVLRIDDILTRRQRMIELLEDHGIDYRRLA